MRKLCVCIVLALLLLVPLSGVYASDGLNFSINGQIISDLWVASFPDENRTPIEFLMLPLRDVAEKVLGLQVLWYPDLKMAIVKPVENEYIRKISEIPVRNCLYYSTTVMFKADSNEIWCTDNYNSAAYKIPGNARITLNNDKIYVPAVVITDFFVPNK